MHRRYIIGALLGALLGFVGLGVTDLVTYSQRARANWFDGSLDRTIAAEHVPAQHVPQARTLFLQGLFLYWLIQRGELAGSTTAIAACLGISAVLATDRLQQIRKERKEASAS